MLSLLQGRPGEWADIVEVREAVTRATGSTRRLANSHLRELAKQTLPGGWRLEPRGRKKTNAYRLVAAADGASPPVPAVRPPPPLSAFAAFKGVTLRVEAAAVAFLKV